MVEIQCPSCNTRYRIDERILPKDRPTFKCSRCGHVFSSALRPSGKGRGVSAAAASGQNAARSEPPRQTEPVASPEQTTTAASATPEAIDTTNPAKAPNVEPQSERASDAESTASARQPADTGYGAAPIAEQDNLAEDLDDGDRWVVEDPISHNEERLTDRGAKPAFAAGQSYRARRPPRSEWTIGAALETFGEQRQADNSQTNARAPEASAVNIEAHNAATEQRSAAEKQAVTPEMNQPSTQHSEPGGAEQSRVRRSGMGAHDARYQGAGTGVGQRFGAFSTDPSSQRSSDFGERYSARGRPPQQEEFDAQGWTDSAARSAGFAGREGEFAARRHPSQANEAQVHSSGFFLMALVGLVAFFGVLTVLISSQPAASREVLALMPFLRDSFAPSSTARQLQLTAIHADFQVLKDNHTALVITGSAVNLTQRPLRTIEIRAALLDENQHDVSTRAVFCGNTVQPGMVGQMTAREIAFFQKLQAPLNFALAPGQRTPFVIAFVDPPSALARSYRVSVGRVEAASDSDNSASAESR
jgi:predicted Zn finger-like uncharacterized protein